MYFASCNLNGVHTSFKLHVVKYSAYSHATACFFFYYSYIADTSKGLFPLWLSLTIARHATQRAAVMEIQLNRLLFFFVFFVCDLLNVANLISRFFLTVFVY